MKPDTLDAQKKPILPETDITALDLFLKRTLSLNHDLNNPLSGILGYAEFLLEESDGMSAEQRDFVKQVIVCAERMARLIADYCEAKDELSEKMDLSRFRT